MISSLAVAKSAPSHLPFADSSTHLYVVRPTDSLYLNFYTPRTPRADHATVVYLYGGAFINGDRNDRQTRLDAQALLNAGFAVAAVDYRKYFGTLNFDSVPKTKMLNHMDTAFSQAASDCAAAIAYLAAHAKQLGIDTSRIILAGSSAGAISVLQLDFARANGLPVARELPSGWRPAAIAAYAGAIFNHHGPLAYAIPPAPTAFFYGETDRVVPFGFISLLSARYGGGECLSSVFHDNKYVYWTFRYPGHGHEVCGYLHRTIPEFTAFADAVLAGRHIHYNTECAADEFKITPASKYTLMQLLRNDSQVEGLFDDDRQQK